MKKKNENIELTEIREYLIKQLSIEKNAGIPSIPENLKPEYMEEFIKKQKPKNKIKKYMIACSGTAAAVFGVIFFSGKIINPQNQSGAGRNMLTVEIEYESIEISDENTDGTIKMQKETPWRFTKGRIAKPKEISFEKKKSDRMEN